MPVKDKRTSETKRTSDNGAELSDGNDQEGKIKHFELTKTAGKWKSPGNGVFPVILKKG